MKTTCLLILVSLFCCVAAQAETLAEWNFDGIDTASTQNDPPYPANITINAGLTNATVHHSQPGMIRNTQDAYRARDWDEASNVASAITLGRYFTVQFNAEEGSGMNLTNFTVYVDEAAGSGDELGYAVTSGVLGHDAAQLLASGTLADGDPLEMVSIDLSGGTYDGLSDIEFRIYAWNITGVIAPEAFTIGNSSKTDGIADIQLSGMISSSAQLGTRFIIK